MSSLYPLSQLARLRGHTVWVDILTSNSVVVDAGAHRGEFSDEIHRRYGSRCISIEANPALAAALVSSDSIQVVNAALAPQDGHATFFFDANPESGSISSAKSATSNGTQTTVRTITLASLVHQFNIPRISLLKLDIEGAEFEVIEQTPDDVLNKIDQITVEFHDFLPHFSSDLYLKSRRRLEALGFFCMGMTFRTHGDMLFLNTKTFALNPYHKFLLGTVARWWGKMGGLKQ